MLLQYWHRSAPEILLTIDTRIEFRNTLCRSHNIIMRVGPNSCVNYLRPQYTCSTLPLRLAFVLSHAISINRYIYSISLSLRLILNVPNILKHFSMTPEKNEKKFSEYVIPFELVLKNTFEIVQKQIMDLSNQLNENYGTFSNHHLFVDALLHTSLMLDKYEVVFTVYVNDRLRIERERGRKKNKWIIGIGNGNSSSSLKKKRRTF